MEIMKIEIISDLELEEGFAELELLLGVSRLLWCFKIENSSPLGKDGKPMPINLDKICNGVTVWPEDYKVRFVKRHDNVEKVLSGQ
ncbi:6742_t:CDS:2, partial [Gigaspora margarita]